jgi:tetratricopeptide (TPR) repeat protein
MQYHVAWCDDRATNDAYMKAAGRNGIPCSFVVDKLGNIAFIGHPMILDEVLPKVLEGTWNAQAEAKAVEAKLESTFEKLQEASQKENGLEIFATIEKDTPRLANQFADFKMMLLLKNKKHKEAEAVFNSVFEKSIKKKDANKLTALCRTWGNTMVNTEKYNMELAVKAGEEAHKLAGPNDIGSLLAVAQAYDAIGNRAKAAEAADKAIEAAPDQLKDRVKQMVQRYKK